MIGRIATLAPRGLILRPRTVVLIAALAAVALLGAGCGGGSATPSVASLGTTSATSTPAHGAPSSGSGGRSGPGSRFGAVIFSGDGVAAFSACMRSHGVPDFPDPNSRGAVSITANNRLDPNSPRFQSAETACQSLMPGPTRAQQTRDEKRALRYSACMRSHGMPSFPDPTFSNGNIGQRGIDLNSPQFQTAQKACASLFRFPG
jgi:hypothetical protein